MKAHNMPTPVKRKKSMLTKRISNEQEKVVVPSSSKDSDEEHMPRDDKKMTMKGTVLRTKTSVCLRCLKRILL